MKGKPTDWKYETRTEDEVKAALKRLLEAKPLGDISISELSQEAGISRSTFYAHFGNVADVYDEIMHEFGDEVSPLMSQVACSDRPMPSGKPFCAMVRDAQRYGAIVNEDRFLRSFLEQGGSTNDHDLHDILVDAGYSDKQAQAVSAFQLSGCFSAARTVQASDEEWGEIRAVIDRFILGGIAACLAARQPRE